MSTFASISAHRDVALSSHDVMQRSLCRLLYILGQQAHGKTVDVKVINASWLVRDHKLQAGKGSPAQKTADSIIDTLIK